MALESLDVRRRSATQTTPPGVRSRVEVAKLIDASVHHLRVPDSAVSSATG